MFIIVGLEILLCVLVLFVFESKFKVWVNFGIFVDFVFSCDGNIEFSCGS